MNTYDQLEALLKEVKQLSPEDRERVNLCSLELAELLSRYGKLANLAIHILAVHTVIKDHEKKKLTNQAQ